MQKRIAIVQTVIDEARKAADIALSSADINDWNDISQPFLTLRQRGKKVSWFVRAFGKSVRLGSAIGQFKDPEYLGLRDVREAARLKYHALAEAHGADAAPPPAWTWADLDREFQASLTDTRLAANGRIKPPSEGTQDDVARMFALPAIAAFGPKLLTELTSLEVTEAIEAVHAANGHRTCAKALTYFKSSMTWALSKRGSKSGLHGKMPWWADLRPPDPTGAELREMKQRRKLLAIAKVSFTVEHLGDLLTRHEAFCADRRGNQKVGPGVRFGLWFLSFTGGRRSATTSFEREGLWQVDPFGRPDWGRAQWTEEAMKGKAEFWLPLPPEVLAIANASVTDWTRLVNNEHGDLKSRWVFASTRRTGRDLANEDVATYPNSLNAHLRTLRGTKKGYNFGTNVLDGLNWFSLHLVRSIVGNYLVETPGISNESISALLSHSFGDEDEDQFAPMTEKAYVQTQRMVKKAEAMDAWCEGLCRAIENAGGKLPQPTETWRPSKVKQKAA